MVELNIKMNIWCVLLEAAVVYRVQWLCGYRNLNLANSDPCLCYPNLIHVLTKGLFYNFTFFWRSVFDQQTFSWLFVVNDIQYWYLKSTVSSGKGNIHVCRLLPSMLVLLLAQAFTGGCFVSQLIAAVFSQEKSHLRFLRSTPPPLSTYTSTHICPI